MTRLPAAQCLRVRHERINHVQRFWVRQNGIYGDIMESFDRSFIFFWLSACGVSISHRSGNASQPSVDGANILIGALA